MKVNKYARLGEKVVDTTVSFDRGCTVVLAINDHGWISFSPW